jgi:hypothetical protein
MKEPHCPDYRPIQISFRPFSRQSGNRQGESFPAPLKKNNTYGDAEKVSQVTYSVRKKPTRRRANNLQKNQTETDIFFLPGRYIV